MDEPTPSPAGDNGPEAQAVAFTVEGLSRGARTALPVALSSVAFGLVFGVLSRQAGLTLAEACLMSGVVFGGSSQLVAVSMWASPLPVVPIIGTTFLINLRHVLMGLTLRPWYSKVHAAKAYGTYFFITDESWALTSVEFQESRPNGAFMLGAGILMWVCWVGATAVGRITGGAIPDPSRWGLDFAFVAVFVALLVSLDRDRGTVAAWSLAAAVAVAADVLLPGTWYVLLGGIAGAVPRAFAAPRE